MSAMSLLFGIVFIFGLCCSIFASKKVTNTTHASCYNYFIKGPRDFHNIATSLPNITDKVHGHSFQIMYGMVIDIIFC